MYYKEEIYDELQRVNNILKKRNLYLDLKIVGGAALIMNGINSVETMDIDTINRIEYEVKEILDECSVDINDDALDYIRNYDSMEFVRDDEMFSNITIEYLSLVGVIKTKMKDTNPDKLQNLYYVLEEELNIEMSVDGIIKWFKDNGEEPDIDDIKTFLEETQVGYKEESAFDKLINVAKF